MKYLKEKIILIFLPFVLVTFGVVIIYDLLFWLIFVKADWDDYKNSWPLIICSLLFIWVPILGWLYKKNDLLFYDEKGGGAIGISIIQFVMMVVLIFATSNLILQVTGKRTVLQNIDLFDKNKRTKYYKLNNYWLNTKAIQYKFNSYTSGKRNTEFNMEISVVMPILKDETDTLNNENKYWVAFAYDKEISNNNSAKTKEAVFNLFKTEVYKEMERINYYDLGYVEEVRAYDDIKYFTALALRDNKVKKDSPIIFEFIYEDFKKRYNNLLGWIPLGIFYGSIAFLLILIFHKFKDEPSKILQEYYK